MTSGDRSPFSGAVELRRHSAALRQAGGTCELCRRSKAVVTRALRGGDIIAMCRGCAGSNPTPAQIASAARSMQVSIALARARLRLAGVPFR